jgi:phosphoribosylformylglycinamidine synthase subunit PurL
MPASPLPAADTAVTFASGTAPLSAALLQQLKALNVRESEYRKIVHFLEREPNFTELCMFSALWSEHCSYKHTRHLLKKLPVTGRQIVQGPGENAGIVDCGQDLHVAFKVESHNHPTYVEPFQGAATGVGGILRDILTMNARPIALLNALRFGPLDEPSNKHRMARAVAGIGHYGNCMGVPTVGGDVVIHPTYGGNPLVNAMAVGMMQPGGMMSAAARGPGNPVVYAGSPTGRDGMGGAAFASRSLDETQSAKDRPAVQVGDPFAEKLVMEACLEAFATGLVVAAQDMGAAGLTCAAAEMSAKGNVGMRMSLDLVPAREPGMVAWEYLLSESQERMVLVLEKGNEQPVLDIFAKWGVPTAIIGEVLAESEIIITHHGQVVAQMDPKLLTDMAPLYAPQGQPTEPETDRANREDRNAWDGLPELLWPKVPQALATVLGSANVGSRQPVFSQYDRHVRNSTLLSSDHHTSGLIRLRTADNQPTGRALAMTLDGNPRHVALHPYSQSQGIVAEAARNLVATGAKPLGVTNNLNFGDPEAPDVYHQLYYTVEGMKEACLAFNTPVTGGNVSLYNTNESGAILPSPVIGMVGLLEDETLATPATFQTVGHTVAVLGRFRPSLGGSEYQALHAEGDCYGRPPTILLREEVMLQEIVLTLIERRLLASCQDVSVGGLLPTLAEACWREGQAAMAIATDLTPLWTTWTGQETDPVRLDTFLFGETHGAFVISYDPNHQAEVEAVVANVTQRRGPASQIAIVPVGSVTGLEQWLLSMNGHTHTLALEPFRRVWQSAITL